MQPRSILHSSWAGQKHALDQWRRHGERPVNGCVHGCQQELFHRGSTNGHWKMTLFWRAESANETFCSSLVILRIRNTSAEATSENFRVSMMSTFINCRGRQVPCLCPPPCLWATRLVSPKMSEMYMFLLVLHRKSHMNAIKVPHPGTPVSYCFGHGYSEVTAMLQTPISHWACMGMWPRTTYRASLRHTVSAARTQRCDTLVTSAGLLSFCHGVL